MNYSFISRRRPNRRIYLDDTYDETKTIKRLAITRRIVGIVAVVLVLLLAAFVAGQKYIPEIIRSMQTEEDQQTKTDVSNIGSDEAISYDETTGLAIYGNNFNLRVINPSNPVGEEFTVETEEVCGISVDKRIAAALEMMTAAAAEDGVELIYESGYISYDEQEIIYNTEVRRLEKEGSTYLMSRAQAKKTVLYPGEADAQTGMSAAVSYTGSDFTATKQFKWLNENAAAYGFIFRYPEWKTSYTGNEGILNIIRYVGTDNAVRMRQLSMCLEEYISYIYDR